MREENMREAMLEVKSYIERDDRLTIQRKDILRTIDRALASPPAPATQGPLSTCFVEINVGDVVGYRDERVTVTALRIVPNGINHPELVVQVNAATAKSSFRATGDNFYALPDVKYQRSPGPGESLVTAPATQDAVANGLYEELRLLLLNEQRAAPFSRDGASEGVRRWLFNNRESILAALGCSFSTPAATQDAEESDTSESDAAFLGAEAADILGRMQFEENRGPIDPRCRSELLRRSARLRHISDTIRAHRQTIASLTQNKNGAAPATQDAGEIDIAVLHEAAKEICALFPPDAKWSPVPRNMLVYGVMLRASFAHLQTIADQQRTIAQQHKRIEEMDTALRAIADYVCAEHCQPCLFKHMTAVDALPEPILAPAPASGTKG